MSLLSKTFRRSLKGTTGLFLGKAAVEELIQFIHRARLAMIGVIVAIVLLCLCLLIISTYFLIQIVQSFT